MPRKTGVPPEISGSLCTTERDATRMGTSYCIDPTALHVRVRHRCLRASCHPCRSSAGGFTRLSNTSRPSIDHTGNLGALGTVGHPAMVRTHTHLSSPAPHQILVALLQHVPAVDQVEMPTSEPGSSHPFRLSRPVSPPPKPRRCTRPNGHSCIDRHKPGVGGRLWWGISPFD